MRLRTMLTLTLGLLLTAPVAIAQDLPTTQVQDHGQVVLHGAMTRSMLRANRDNARRGSSNASIARAKCALATRRAEAGNGDPTLLRMCAKAGYR